MPDENAKAKGGEMGGEKHVAEQYFHWPGGHLSAPLIGRNQNSESEPVEQNYEK